MASISAYRAFREHHLEWGLVERVGNTSILPPSGDIPVVSESKSKSQSTKTQRAKPSISQPPIIPKAPVPATMPVHQSAENKTKKLYVEGLVSANNVKLLKATETTMILDSTVFHPQGGGQPCDIGTIIQTNQKEDNTHGIEFAVSMVKEDRSTGLIEHTGTFTRGCVEDLNNCSEEVSLMKLEVDVSRRVENTRNHSAGHLLDVVMTILGFNLTPSKGYHFPDGSHMLMYIVYLLLF